MCQARFFARFCFFQLVQTPLAAEFPLNFSVAVGQENPVEPVILAEMAAAVQAMEMAATMPRSFLLQSK
ncbi:MAG: hypothetical protein J6V90_01060 [Treponema sp.]|nr:hypothetical protein [Treponema sp.]